MSMPTAAVADGVAKLALNSGGIARPERAGRATSSAFRSRSPGLTGALAAMRSL